jgi:hypothetical protein
MKYVIEKLIRDSLFMKALSISLLISTFIVSYKQIDAQAFEVKCDPGKSYYRNSRFLFISAKKTPEFAIWLEDTFHNYVSTIFVTYGAAKKFDREIHPLPVWVHALKNALPDNIKPSNTPFLSDSIIGEAPTHFRYWFEIQFRTDTILQHRRYLIRIEVNQYADFNEMYSADLPSDDPFYSHKWGQPSVIWESLMIIPGDFPQVYKAYILGHGDPQCKTGQVFRDTTGLTTAVQIFSQITIDRIE